MSTREECFVKLCSECSNLLQDWCTKCEAGLCCSCAVDHLTLNVRDHNVVPYRGRYKSYTVRSRCYLHGQKYSKKYCWNCLCHFCDDCTTPHTNHVLSSKSSVTEEEFVTVFNSLNALPYYKFQLERNLNLIEVVNLRDTRKERDTRCIGSVASVCHGSFWITLENRKGSLIFSEKYDFRGRLMEKIYLPPKVSCFHSVNSCGNVYYFNEANDSIDLLKDGGTQVIQDLKQLQLNKNKMICGLYSNIFDVIFLAISYVKLKRGIIVRLDTTSGAINAIDFDSRGESLYESPRCTDENANGILCTVDVKGTVLFQLSTNKKIPCVEISYLRSVATNFKEQFLVCYGPEICPLLGIITDNGEMLRAVPFPFGEIELICCDTKNNLLIVTNYGSVIKRISLNMLQRS